MAARVDLEPEDSRVGEARQGPAHPHAVRPCSSVALAARGVVVGLAHAPYAAQPGGAVPVIHADAAAGQGTARPIPAA